MKKWNELAKEQRESLISHLRTFASESDIAMEPYFYETFAAAADELEHPTWEADTDPAPGETKW